MSLLQPVLSRAVRGLQNSQIRSRSGSPSRFASPLFTLAYHDDSASGGGGAGDGYGSEGEIPTETLSKAATDLAVDNKSDYEPEGNVTHCSEFVRDYATNVVGREMPELAGVVSTQVRAISESEDWTELNFAKDPQLILQQAQIYANSGKLVIAAWANPTPTDTDSGHIAVVVPNPTSATSKDGMDASGKWGLRVPYIAQAGKKVFAKGKLSEGFGPECKSGLRIFVWDP
jgi:hypothetical protein